MSESQQNSSIVQRLEVVEETVSRLSATIDKIVNDLLHPVTQQSMATQDEIAGLIEIHRRHQDWLDESRHDLNRARDEYRQSTQILIDDARADRKRADDNFDAIQKQHEDKLDAMQAEIRSNSRILLSNQEKLERNQQQLEIVLAEVLSLSRRVAVVEDAG